jgi:UDP-glucose 4-epimerase
MDTALVTGGAGFLGSHVARSLVERGTRVVVLDDRSGGFRRNVPPGVELHWGSICDAARVDALFSRHRFRHVYHLAAYAAEALSPFIRRFNYRINVEGSVNLINAAVNHGTECFVFTSSIAVYGRGRCPFREDAHPAPEDPYGIAKLAVEQDLRAATELFGMSHVIFRPHNVYGERQNLSDPYRNVIGIFLRQALRGEPCTIFGDGLQTRAFSWVGDVAPLIADAVHREEARNETFNVGSDEAHTLNELAELVQGAAGRRVGVRHLPPREEVQHAVSDHAKARRVLGHAARVGLAEGLERAVRWARTIDIAPPRAVAEIEIRRKLPPSWLASIK